MLTVIFAKISLEMYGNSLALIMFIFLMSWGVLIGRYFPNFLSSLLISESHYGYTT